MLIEKFTNGGMKNEQFRTYCGKSSRFKNY